jgi:gliding motility-associated-like protein
MKPLYTFLLLLSAFCPAIVFSQPCDMNLGPDVSVCNNATFTLNPNADPNGGTYTWTGSAGLSCYDCPSPTVSGLTTGTYFYIATQVTAECTLKDTLKITVVAGQQPQYNIADDQPICIGQSVFIGGLPFPFTSYQWTSQPIGFNASGPNPSVSPTQTTTYFLIAFNNTCPYVSIDSVKISVFQPPVLDVQGDTSICNGESVALGATVPQPDVTYLWSPNNGTLNNINIANPVATPLQTTTYQLSATNPGCTVNRSVQVSVINFDLTLNVPDTVPACKGVPVPIQATLNPPGGLVSWSPLNGLQVGAGGLSAVATPNQSTLYTATATVPGCIRKETVYIELDSIPENLDIVPADTAICQGQQVMLVSPPFVSANFPNISFEWTGAGQVTPGNLYNMTVQPNQTTTYRRITTNGVCRDTAEATVNVAMPPVFGIVPSDTSICPGQSVALEAVFSPGVTDITWVQAEGLSCTLCTNPVAMPASTTTYTFAGKFQGCPVSTTTTINVRDLPLIQFPDDTELCFGDSLVLNELLDTSSTYFWTSTDPSFSASTENQPVIKQTVPTATYFVMANNGCSYQGQITINVVSATLQVDGDTTVCQNFPALLSASGSLPGTYEWSTGQTGQSVEVKPSGTTTYTVVYTYGNGCTLTDNVTVVTEGVGPNIVFPEDNELCPGESVVLNSAVTPGATYTWTSNPAGFTSNQAIPPAQTPAQTTRYVVTATLDNCTTTQTLDVIVYNATLTVPSDVTICGGESIELIADGSLTGEYLWSTGDTTTAIEVSPAVATTYDVLYTYGDGCSLEEMVTVSVKPGFTLSVISDPDTNRINIGDPLSLRARVMPSQNLTNFQFEWLENGTVNIGNTEIVETTPSTNDSTVFYKLTAIAPNGCVQDTIIRFTLVQPLVVVPNAFTPNGDNVNDLFRLTVLEGAVTVLEMSIYNRWGKQVYTSNDPAAVWDGKTQDGKEAPSDVYVYFIRWQRSDGALQTPRKGDVTLLR